MDRGWRLLQRYDQSTVSRRYSVVPARWAETPAVKIGALAMRVLAGHGDACHGEMESCFPFMAVAAKGTPIR